MDGVHLNRLFLRYREKGVFVDTPTKMDGGWRDRLFDLQGQSRKNKAVPHEVHPRRPAVCGTWLWEIVGEGVLLPFPLPKTQIICEANFLLVLRQFKVFERSADNLLRK